jgi:hypothetical protein
MGRTFYPRRRLSSGLLAEDDAGEVQVRLRRLHVPVPRLRHDGDLRCAGGGVVRDRRVAQIVEGTNPIVDASERESPLQRRGIPLRRVRAAGLGVAKDLLVLSLERGSSPRLP